MVRTPAWSAFRTAETECAWARQYLPTARALLHRGPHRLHRVLGGVELVRRRHGAPRDHELDPVNVVAELLPRRPAHLVGAVRDHADHADAAVERRDPLRPPPLVAVPARLGKHAPRNQQPRPGVEARGRCLAEAVVGAARVAHRGEALQQRLLHAAEGLHFSSARGDHSIQAATP
jgi:hypothetical protein